jgi:hypothetical protein
MLNVTLYVPGVSPGIVPGDFHDCPGRPSISTAAPIGTDETINCPSAAAGGATGADGAFFAAFIGRDEEDDDEDACACAFSVLPCWLNGAEAAPGAEFAGCAVALSVEESEEGWCCNISASPTIRQIPPTTSPVNLQWFVGGSCFLVVVVFAGSPYVVPGEAGRACVCEAEGTALNDWLAEGAGGFHSDWLAEGPVLTAWLAEGDCTARIDWLAEGPGLWYAGRAPVALARAAGSAFDASSSAAKNFSPLAYRSAGFLASALSMTLEIASGTRGCAMFNGYGSTSLMLRSTSPRCLPWNGLRPV